LHAGGAIGADGSVEGVRVHLGEPLTRFVLPHVGTPEDLVNAVRASMKFLNVAPDVVSVPLFAGVWRAALGGTDFSQFLVGPTGTFKTALAALVQQHWGAGLDARHLPASWKSTANANEALAFLGKDAVLVVDDFAPTGSQYDVQKMHRDADHLLRGQGNLSGRGRMRPDASLRPPKPPRGMILGTGEDVPRGQSLQARILILEVSPGTIRPSRLSKRQCDAEEGLYAMALSGFVRWLAQRYETVKGEPMRELFLNFRKRATNSTQHRRTPGIVADLALGMELFTRYATDCRALTDEAGDELRERTWTALGEAASRQTSFQQGSDQVQRFFGLLRAALAAGKAHVANKQGYSPKEPKSWGWSIPANDWLPRGTLVGWVDGNSLYLEPEAAYAVAQAMAQAGGEPLTVSSKTLHKRLKERGLLASTDRQRGRLVVRRTLEGHRREVLHLRVAALWDE
jgi:hypothetical protein